MVSFLTNGQAAVHYSRHRLTASLIFVTTLTHASINNLTASVQLSPSVRALRKRICLAYRYSKQNRSMKVYLKTLETQKRQKQLKINISN